MLTRGLVDQRVPAARAAARRARCHFQARTLERLEPPLSAVISSLVALGNRSRPIASHQRRIEATANSAVSATSPAEPARRAARTTAALGIVPSTAPSAAVAGRSPVAGRRSPFVGRLARADVGRLKGLHGPRVSGQLVGG